MLAFLRTLLLGTLMLLTGATGFTVFMDPFDWWGTPRIEGLNARRSGGNEHVSWVKPRQYARGAPWGAVVAGNSRVQLGFDPDAAAWPEALRPVYNFGLPGASFPALVDRLEWTLPEAPPPVLMVGLDLVDFRVSAEEWAAWRPGPRPALSAGVRIERMLQATFSLDALNAAIAAVPQQRSAFPADMTAAGFVPMRPYELLARRIGQAAMFDQRNRENFANYLERPKAVRWPGPGGSDAWAALDRLKALADAHDIRLIVFTYPYHRDLLVGLDRAGLSPALADFRLAVAQWGQQHGVEAWDFTRLNAWTTVRIPEPGDRTTLLQDYWEAGHFRAAMGERMVAAMLSGQAPPGFGARLSVAEAQRVNAGWQAGLAAALHADPAGTARMERLYARAEGRDRRPMPPSS